MRRLANINYNLATVYYIRTWKTRSCNCPQLEGEAQDSVLEIEPNQITDRNGVKRIIDTEQNL